MVGCVLSQLKPSELYIHRCKKSSGFIERGLRLCVGVCVGGGGVGRGVSVYRPIKFYTIL